MGEMSGRVSSPHSFTAAWRCVCLSLSVSVMWRAGVLLLAVLGAVAGAARVVAADATPEQVHLSFTGKESTMGLDFVSTHAEGAECAVHFAGLDVQEGVQVASSTSELYYENVGWMHQVELKGLTPNTGYEYRIGCPSDEDSSMLWSDRYEFRAGVNMDREDGGHIAAVYADFGLHNDVSMPFLKAEAKQGGFDFIAHIGDLAYNLDDEDEGRGNTFMNTVESFAAEMPYMATVGNHEKHTNFTSFARRFKATADFAGKRSKSHSNFFYSWDADLIHYVMIDTEVWKFAEETANSPYPYNAVEQMQWLEEDLRKANDNRDNVPWIVMMGHKGFFMPLFGGFQLDWTHIDTLACIYGVDLYLTGHVHYYGRFAPLRADDRISLRATPQDVDWASVSEDGHTYTNPKYMPTIVVASPGDQELTIGLYCPGLDILNQIWWEDSQITCVPGYGYGHLQAVNETHMYWDFKKTGVSSHVWDFEDDGAEEIAAGTMNDVAEELSRMSSDIATGKISEEDFRKFLNAAGQVSDRNAPGRRIADFHRVDEDDGILGIKDHMWLIQENHGMRDWC